MGEPYIVARDVTCLYHKSDEVIRAVDGVSLSFEHGEFAALHGTSGAGKSTLLGLIGGLGRPTAGSITVDGQDLGALNQEELALFRRRKVGFVFQSFYLVPTLTAMENVEVPLLPIGLPSSERHDRAAAALAEVGLTSRLDHLPGELSGGEQQRVVMARALVLEPELILADEPTSDLDRGTAERVIELLERLNRDRGCTVLMATHDLRVLDHVRRRIEMEDGRVIAEEA